MYIYMGWKHNKLSAKHLLGYEQIFSSAVG
jgi:hypothetical protein